MRTRLTRVLVTSLMAAGLAIVGGVPAQALDDLVCEKWGHDRITTIDDPVYGEVTLVEATCELWGWAGKGPKEPTDPVPPTDPWGGGRDVPDLPERCSDVEEQTKSVQESLAAYRQELAVGTTIVTAEQAQVWVLTQIRDSAQTQADAAIARRAAAEAAYVQELGLEDILVDNGHGAVIRHPVTVTRASIDSTAKSAPALRAAMNQEGSALLDLRQAQLDYDAAAGDLSAHEEALRVLEEAIDALTAQLQALEKAAGSCKP